MTIKHIRGCIGCGTCVQRHHSCAKRAVAATFGLIILKWTLKTGMPGSIFTRAVTIP